MSIARKISIKKALMNVVDETSEDVARELPLMYKWALHINRKIDSINQLTRSVTVIDVVGCTVQIPAHVEHVVAIVMGDNGCCCDAFWNLKDNTYVWEPVSQISQIGVTNIYAFVDDLWEGQNDLDYHIQDDKIVFTRNYTGKKVTLLTLGYEQDEEGSPLVSENNVDAIVKYVKLQMAEREKWKLMKKAVPLNQISAEINGLRSEVNYYVSQARDNSNELSKSQQSQISNLLNNPITGYRTYLLQNSWI
jgi:hypothetical protein